MKRNFCIFLTGLAILSSILLVIFCGSYAANADMLDWHEDSRVWSEYDESGFGFYGIDEEVHFSNRYMIYIHYEPDYSGGWCRWAEYDCEGQEWNREIRNHLNMAELSRTVDEWGREFVHMLDLMNVRA